jgi:hypothetical protein
MGDGVFTHVPINKSRFMRRCRKVLRFESVTSLPPKPAAGYFRAFCHGGEFRVSDFAVYGTETCERREATIAACNDSLTSDNIGEATYTLGDEFRVFNEIRG